MADFQVGLCDCFMDCSVCCIGYFCPCYLMAMNVARIDGREMFCCECCCMSNPSWIVRQRVRSKYGLEYTYCTDCCLLIFCGCCHLADCQHANEMKVREKGSVH